MPAIREITKQGGKIEEGEADKIARYFELTRSQIFSTYELYQKIQNKELTEITVGVCDGATCSSKGGEEIVSAVEKYLETNQSGIKLNLERVGCFGQCMMGPNVQIGEVIYGKIFADKVERLLDSYFG